VSAHLEPSPSEVAEGRVASREAAARAAVAREAAEEPTLAALATRVARTTVPHRLYLLAQLAIPVAADLAWRGWWRGAGGAVAVAAFGAWGLADRWLARRGAMEVESVDRATTGDDEPPVPANVRRTAAVLRVVRGVAGALAIALPFLLLLDLFIRLLGTAPIS
jgi:hypothetical protein